MKKTIPLFCLIIILASCSTTVKSKSQIVNCKVEIVKMDTSENLLCKITGNTADSALWIKRYSIQYKGSEIKVFIEKSLQTTRISDPYYIQFIDPETEKKIYLGNGELIWKRSN